MIDIKEVTGLKDKATIEALKHENPNYKAFVLISEGSSPTIKIEQIVPFTSVEKAQEYIDTELPLLGLSGLILKVNEEEKKQMYGVRYDISGIYGNVTFFKHFNNLTQNEIISMSDKIKKCYKDSVNGNYFTVNVRSEDYTFESSSDIILGLPEGITEDMYFRMATIQNMPTQTTQNINCSIDKISEKVQNDIFQKITEKLKSTGVSV